MASSKVYKAHVLGTGLNAIFYVRNYEIEAYPASTYHVFTHMDGAVEKKNDFGISSVTVIEVDPSEVPRLA